MVSECESVVRPLCSADLSKLDLGVASDARFHSGDLPS